MDKVIIPVITVVMPVYNAGLYLKDAIDSILDQSFSNFEFHIVDDGSTDSSVEIIHSYSDSRILFTQNETNKGITITLNEAYSRISSKYIVRMDADDIALNHRLQTQFDFMENNPDISIAGSWFTSTDCKVHYQPYVEHKDIVVGLLEKSQFGHPTVIIRNESWKKNNLFYSDEYMHAEDYACWCNAVNKGLILANIPEPLLLYRSHQEQISESKTDIQKVTSNNIRLRYFLFYFPQLNSYDLNIYKNLLLGNFANYSTYTVANALCKNLILINKAANYFSCNSFKLFLLSKLKAGTLDIYCKIIDPSPKIFLLAFFDDKFYTNLSLSQIIKFPFKLLKKIVFG